MITASSPIFRSRSWDTALAETRAQVLIRLCQFGLPFEDIGTALNCSESLVRSMLNRPFRSSVGNGIAPIQLEVLSKPECGDLLKGPLAPIQAGSNARENLTRHLRTELRRWLDTFNMSDEDRRSAIGEAGKQLDQSILYMENDYSFDLYKVSHVILSAWSPFLQCSSRMPFWLVAGRWLAGWIHFWIVDPTIWDPVVDFELAHEANAAKAA
jgi:hypothetical protein